MFFNMFLNITLKSCFLPAIKIGFYTIGFNTKLYFQVIAVEPDLPFVYERAISLHITHSWFIAHRNVCTTTCRPHSKKEESSEWGELSHPVPATADSDQSFGDALGSVFPSVCSHYPLP